MMNGRFFVAATNQIAIDHSGIVRPQSHFSAGGKGIIASAALGHGIVIDHGVHIAAGDEKGQARFSQNPNTLGILPVRLGDDSHSVASGFQHPTDDGVAEGGMVHIGVAHDIDKITLIPAPGLHIRPGDRQKIAHGYPPSITFTSIYYIRCVGKSPEKAGESIGEKKPHRPGLCGKSSRIPASLQREYFEKAKQFRRR